MGIFDKIFGNQNVNALANALSNEVVSRMTSTLQKEFAALAEVDNATAQVIELRKQLATLEAEKSNIEKWVFRNVKKRLLKR